ncbi:MAG TPA: LysR family transcriptional regulator [Polyangiales bacterium]|nr:LysR family transcriptional regulator [Polyangiales bacterium]
MLDQLRGLVVFAEVVDGKSFARAAERLGMTRSAVSKHVAQLEAQLGVQLLSRTTRKLSLTEVGERVYAASSDVREAAELAREAAHTHQGMVEGTLRVTAPVGLGRPYLIPLADELMRLHPRLEIALILSDQYIDLVEERIDVALRVGRAADSTLVTRKIGPMAMAFCAAPRYLAERGTPRHPRDLEQHPVIRHLPRIDGGRMTLRKGRRSAQVEPTGRLSCNDGATSVAAAVHGMGVFVGPEFEFAHEVRAGRLARVLVGWTTDVLTLHAVAPPRRHVSSKVRAFVDFVGERWRKPPWSLAK